MRCEVSVTVQLRLDEEMRSALRLHVVVANSQREAGVTFIDEIFDLFADFGAGHYGEQVSLERHMLQAAAMAESCGASDTVIAAALLHDIGYFLHGAAEASLNAGHDFEHEAIGAAWLSRGFDERVTVPVALHVPAKRYLCAIDLEYSASLSAASRLSLAAQGGVMNDAEVRAFSQGPAFEDALMLRRCDDRGKEIGAKTPPLARYRPLLESLTRR